jgi:hypothetical protein
MMRYQHDNNKLDKKFLDKNNQTFSHLFKKNKDYLFIKFIHPINLKKKSYKHIRSIVFDVSI